MARKSARELNSVGEGRDGKRFMEWIRVKKRVHNANKIPCFRKGEIWWVNIGENVGIEINGKGDGFYRPVIIIKKLGMYGFLAIPLTSKFHNGWWYANFEFQGRQQYAALAQIRVLSSARLCNRLGEMSKQDFELVKSKLIQFFA